MTKTEFFKAVAETETISAELRDFAKTELETIAKRNETRRNTLTPAQVANEELKAKMLEVLANGGKTAKDMGTAMTVSTNKASALLCQLEKTGKVTATHPKNGAKFYELAE